jgi:hypothetical protein
MLEGGRFKSGVTEEASKLRGKYNTDPNGDELFVVVD